MRNYEKELEKRVAFIVDMLKRAGADGIVYGNSGGKDSVLVGILCKKACDNTLGVIMPCGSKQNYASDMEDALAVAAQYQIETETVDLSATKNELLKGLDGKIHVTDAAAANIAPRLRMTALYAVAASQNRIVAGTGNRSETHMGYFTKWGDGASDFNPIADLTVTEVYGFLEFLEAPASIIRKPPSAGLYEGQTDEAEMGIGYAKIDRYLLRGEADAADSALIEAYHSRSEHKRSRPATYAE